MLNKYQLDDGYFSIKEQEEVLFDSIKEWLQRDSSERIVEKFRYLFIKGNGCDCPTARSALVAILNSPNVETEFDFIFDRCFHLIINEWQVNPHLRAKIPLLIDQIALALPVNQTQSRSTRKLRNLVLTFQDSERYLKLKRLSNLIGKPQFKTSQIRTKTIGDRIKRYPYLHQQCLLGEDSSYEYKKTILKLQKSLQNRYELNLSRYITYRVRLVEIVRKYKANNQQRIPKTVIKPVKNPTLLSDRDLDSGLREYLGTIENGYTYCSLAVHFNNQLSYVNSHKEFKRHLYEYLTMGFDCQYSQKVLKPKLSNYLDSILPDVHANTVDDFTLLRTCSLLLKFLVVDSLRNPNHYLFVDTLTHLGSIKTVGLLLKIILACNKAKPYLAQRLSILFTYYEAIPEDNVQWLVNALETLQLALSIHYGQLDISVIRII